MSIAATKIHLTISISSMLRQNSASPTPRHDSVSATPRHDSVSSTCQNCKNQFIIEPEDFLFYEKMQVPAPTWCPKCRLQRQLSFRNERSLYKRKCGAPGHTEEIITIYAPESQIKVYDQKYWWSDKWEATHYGKDYNFQQPFFGQLRDLVEKVPWPNLVSTNSMNSSHCNSVLNLVNSYLIFGAIDVEGSAYGQHVDVTKDSFDIDFAAKNELCYELINCNGCYQVICSAFSEQCHQSAFLFDCIGCHSCFGCVGLRNKSYWIFNKPYTKEGYFAELGKLDLGSFSHLSEAKSKFEHHRFRYPYKYARVHKSVDSTGDNIQNTKNCYHCFDAHGDGVEDSRYIYYTYTKPVKSSHSVYLMSNGELSYESISIRECSNVLFSKKVWTGHHIQYSYNCYNCAYVFGCVGLRDKQYCILNKQYTKEEYEKLIPKIIQHMNEMPYADKKGRVYQYGEFFSPELSPFAYNETIAQEYFPLTKEQALTQGYNWKDPEKRSRQFSMTNLQLPDHSKDVPQSITEEVIQCGHHDPRKDQSMCNEQCTEAYRVIPQEFEFYKKMNLPLPRLCPNCRHYQRLKQRNPIKLWHRTCACAGEKSQNGVYQNQARHLHGASPCPHEFETSYAPDRPEIVYCEQCYQAEAA